MKLLKTISRYFFMELLLVGCVIWSVYCGNAAAKMQAQIESSEFIDMTLRSTTEATALLDRQARFETLTKYGIIAAVIVLLLTLAMILVPIIAKKWKNRPKREVPVGMPPAPYAPPPPYVQQSAPYAPPPPYVQQPVPYAPPAPYAQQPAPYAPPAPYAQQPAPCAPPVQAVFCSHCGKQQTAGAGFCADCGQRIV